MGATGDSSEAPKRDDHWGGQEGSGRGRRRGGWERRGGCEHL